MLVAFFLSSFIHALVIQEIYTIPINSARLKVSKGYASKVKRPNYGPFFTVREPRINS